MKYLKSAIISILAISFIGISSAAFAAEGDVYNDIYVLPNFVTLKVDGLDIQSPNFVHEGTTYIPLRRMAELLGKDVKWDGLTSTVTIGGRRELSAVTSFEQETADMAVLDEGNISAIVNGVTIIVDGTVIKTDNYMYNDRTYVPLRVISEGFKNSVNWNGNARLVTVESGEYLDSCKVAATIDGTDFTVGDLKYFVMNEIEVYEGNDTALPHEELRNKALYYAKFYLYTLKRANASGLAKSLESEGILDEFGNDYISNLKGMMGDVVLLDGFRTAGVNVDTVKRMYVDNQIMTDYMNSEYAVRDGLMPTDEEAEKYFGERKEELKLLEGSFEQYKQFIKQQYSYDKINEQCQALESKTNAAVFDSMTF